MKITVELNKVKIERDIPTSYDTVTWRQFIDLSEAGDDYAKVLSVFTGQAADVIRKAKIHNLDAVLQVLKFLNVEPVPVIPESILGYKVPKDLGFEYIGQFEDLKEELKKGHTGTEALEAYTKYVAVYACPSKHGDYDWKLAEEMAHEFYDAPCQEVLGIGNFTLRKLIGLRIPTRPSFQRRSTLMKKLKLVLTAFRFRLAFWVRSITWLKNIRLTKKVIY